MIGIAFRFPGGQYHATPWQRHVNEAEVEWPPSPWRILRALIAVWYHKGGSDVSDVATLESLIHALADEMPEYELPPAVHTNVRHYMPVGGYGKTALVYNGFLRIGTSERLVVRWPRVALAESESQLLQFLVERMGYLGRAESWVIAELIGAEDIIHINCRPLNSVGDEVGWNDVGNGSGAIHIEKVLLPNAPDEFASWLRNDTKTRSISKKEKNIPQNLFEALCVDTNELERAGRLQPIGAMWVLYVRPDVSARVLHDSVSIRTEQPKLHGARFAFLNPITPGIEETVDVADIFHMALLKKCGIDAPSVVSGRHENGQLSEGHKHLFILPEDADNDGRLDHITLYSAEPFTKVAMDAITRLNCLWTPQWWPGAKREWQLFLEGFFGFSGTQTDTVVPLLQVSRTWRSRTPYLHPWHRKKNGKFGPEDQIRRELQTRGLPEPVRIQEIGELRIHGRAYRTLQFRRSRRSKRSSLPDTNGSFWEIEFPDEVHGPLALGGYCHFGLGMFIPMKQTNS